MRRALPIILIIAVSSLGYIYFTQNREPEHELAQPKYDSVEEIVEACAEVMGGAEVIEVFLVAGGGQPLDLLGRQMETWSSGKPCHIPSVPRNVSFWICFSETL